MCDSEEDFFQVKPATEIDILSKKLYFASFEWEIKKFSQWARKADESINSPCFFIRDSSWELSVFPNGERWNGTVGKVGISLTKISPLNVERTVFSEIIIQRDLTDNVFNVKYTFNESFRSCRFPIKLSRNDVLRKDSGYLVNGSLNITCLLFVLGEDSPQIPSRPVMVNPKSEKTSVKKDAGTNTSSKDFGNLCFYKDPPTEKEHYLTLISKDFEEMYNNQRFADVVLKLREHEFPVHKLILRSRSKVFEAMFEHDMQENRQDTVDLVDMEADTVRDMLRYIYCGKVRQLSPEEALNLYVAADRYDLQELVLHCRRLILDTLSVDNLCKVSAVADLHNDQFLTDKVKSILCKNMKEVLKTEKWKMFAKENPVLSLKLISLAILNE